MSSKYSSNRPYGREHIPDHPKGFIALRIVQLILSVVVLGLDAYTLSLLSFDANQLNIFTAVWTMIIGIYYIVVEIGGPQAWKGYNYWAVLVLDILSVIFWLVSFALMAARVAPFAGGIEVCGIYECVTYALEGDYLTLFACCAAVAGIGGLEFALFIISLTIHSIVLHRHRAAGLHCTATSSRGVDGPYPTGPGDQSAVPLGGGPVPGHAAEKHQATTGLSAVPASSPPPANTNTIPTQAYAHNTTVYNSIPQQQQQQQQQGMVAGHGQYPQ
ncbi:hypothetical protein BD289DRAFT_432355 [Coniella lustricola]|uniref:MARVEL domain-containing protein n=1 Tax=Coniella lustricola TaxID=2025994 RepID=A0A2T3A9W5_9PEZI|nr:hypothetical protein BD289DRAFT_432355 [Coniella lustricola]